MLRFLAACSVLISSASAANHSLPEAGSFVKSVFNNAFAKLEDVNPCILPGSEYKFLDTVSLPKSDHFPHAGSCVVLGEKSYLIFTHLKPIKTRIGTSPGYIGVMFRYVTTMKTFKASYGTSYESFEGQGNPLIRFTALSEEKYNTLRDEGVPLAEMYNKSTAYALGLQEKICAKLAGMANICTGVAPEGRRLSTRGRALEGHANGSNHSFLMSMDISEVDGSKKSVKMADVSKNGSLAPLEKPQFKDGDGGMSAFVEAKEWDAKKVRKPTKEEPKREEKEPKREEKEPKKTELTDQQKKVADFFGKTFSFAPLKDVNPCILPNSEYKLLATVSVPKSDILPFGGSCVVLGERSYLIFAHMKPIKTRFGNTPGYMGIMFRYVTTMKTFEGKYGTSYEAFEGVSGPLVRLSSFGEEKVNELRESGISLNELANKSKAFGIGLQEKVCAKLAGMADICTGLAPAAGRRLSEHGGSGSLLMSMDVDKVDGAKKSMKMADVDKSGSVTSPETTEFTDGDGGMSEFAEAKEFDQTKVKKKPAKGSAATTETKGTTAEAVAASAVVTHGSAGLSLVLLLAYAVFF